MKGVVNASMFFLTLTRLCHYLQIRLQFFMTELKAFFNINSFKTKNNIKKYI